MNKFTTILSSTGSNLLKRRSEILSKEVYEAAMDQKREIEKQIRHVKNNIANLEDLSVKSTESLIVGEDLDASDWVLQRLNYSIELVDLNRDLNEMNKIIEEYFADSIEAEPSATEK